MTVKEVAATLKVSEAAIYKAIKTGRLTATTSRVICVPDYEVRKLMEKLKK